MIGKNLIRWCCLTFVGIIAGLLLLTVLHVQPAHAQEETVTVTQSITATVAGNGSIIIPPTQVTNSYQEPIHLISVQCPSGYSWSNDGEGKDVEPGTTLTINWTADASSSAAMAERLSQSQNNNEPVSIGSITYTYTLPQKTAFAVLSGADGSLNFYNRTEVPKVGDQFEGKKVTSVYILENDVTSTDPPWTDEHLKIRSSTVVDEGIKPLSTSKWFFDCRNLKTADLHKLDTSQVTTMKSMFTNCQKVTDVNISTWDTSKVTDMYQMFGWCYELTSLDIADWDVSNVTTMNHMFIYCMALPSLNLCNWNTARVTDLEGAFMGCYSLVNLDVDLWDTSSVTNMSWLFYACNKLERLNLKNWDTSQVTTMQTLFYNSNYPIKQAYEVSLQQITFGPKWKWVGTNGLLYPPIEKFYPGADGKWYDQDGIAYDPKDIPNNKAGTYYPLKSLVP